VSFSGGETSGFMLLWILENWRSKYDEIVVVFANTSQENEETLLFVDQVAKYADVHVVWVEAVTHLDKGCTHKIVDFKTASRNGEPFEEMIKQYGIPNPSWPHCNREMKLNPMRSYLRSIGWMKGTYDVAIGIRSDEIDRVRSDYKKERIVYPFAFEKPTTKNEVNVFWRDMPFRLQLKGYQGNCKWCWKKTLRKHLTIIDENPEAYDFPRRMEKLHGKAGASIEEGVGCNDQGQRVFFRKNRSTDDLFELAKQGFSKAVDDADVYEVQMGLLDDLDLPGACGESCDAFSDEVA
jgi:hypothetical protein